MLKIFIKKKYFQAPSPGPAWAYPGQVIATSPATASRPALAYPQAEWGLQWTFRYDGRGMMKLMS